MKMQETLMRIVKPKLFVEERAQMKRAIPLHTGVRLKETNGVNVSAVG